MENEMPKIKKMVGIVLLLGVILVPVMRVKAVGQATRVSIAVYLDINGDKLMSAGEGIENLPVIVDVDGQRQNKMTRGGQVDFSLPYANTDNLRIEVSYLALAAEVTTDKDGVARVEFRLTAPELPVYLP
jgi:hypothetical protein